MSEYHVNDVLPPTAQDAIDELAARLREQRHLADEVPSTPVVGPRGQDLTVGEAQQRARALGEQIDLAGSLGSLRHRRVEALTRVLVFLMVSVVDFPIMSWLTASVFNVDWTRSPFGLPLLISAVVAVLVTAGAATALHHIGRDQRQNKNHRRQLDTHGLTASSRISLVAVGLLVTLIAVGAFYRVWTEGVYSGLDNLALLLAVLVAVVMLVSAWLVFWTAFRDGSLDQDDLAYYTRIVQPHVRRRLALEREISRIEERLSTLSRRTGVTAVVARQAALRPGIAVTGTRRVAGKPVTPS